MNPSVASLKRLPQYLRILKKKREENITHISSTAVANELNLNSIQVRKDLALVSHSDGKPGIGFEVNQLINDIEDFLDLNDCKEVIIVGAGRLGQALMNHTEFENEINIVMAFDKDERICNNETIFNIKDFEKLVKGYNIHIGIITVPKQAAQEVCDMMVSCGIKAIWNFAPINLKIPSDVVIKNEDLSTSLSILLRSLNKNNIQGGK